MSFVRTDDEVERVRERMAENRYRGAEALDVRFRTDPAFVERVLPPGLEPTDDPIAQVGVHRIAGSNCVGGFEGGGLYVGARHGDRVGRYCLAMPMSTDAAITWGRELFGEPKKLADITLDRDGDRAHGRIERRGETVVELDAELSESLDADGGTDTVFHYKFQPAVDGDGFRADPQLIAAQFDSTVQRFESGTATLELTSTAHDPYGDVPVAEVLEARHTVADLRTSQTVLSTVDPEAFAPYAFGTGRVDDWLALGD